MSYQFHSNNGIWHHKMKLTKLPFSLSVKMFPAPKIQTDKILHNLMNFVLIILVERLQLSLKNRVEGFGIWTIEHNEKIFIVIYEIFRLFLIRNHNVLWNLRLIYKWMKSIKKNIVKIMTGSLNAWMKRIYILVQTISVLRSFRYCLRKLSLVLSTFWIVD